MRRSPRRHEGIEDDAIDRIAGFEKIAHHGAAGYSGNAEVVFLKGIDNHIPNVSVIVDDENVLRVAHHSSTPVVSPKRRDVSPPAVLIVTSMSRCVGNVHYRISGQLAFYAYVLGR